CSYVDFTGLEFESDRNALFHVFCPPTFSFQFPLEKNRKEQLEKYYPNLICTQSLGHDESGGSCAYSTHFFKPPAHVSSWASWAQAEAASPSSTFIHLPHIHESYVIHARGLVKVKKKQQGKEMKGLCWILVFVVIFGWVQGDLQMGFYGTSCPKAEKIVQDYVNEHIPNAPSLAATLIRMHFHDCFVRGGPTWKVPTGRRDGLLSNASEALAQIPAPFDNITILIQKFANKSLDLKDLVLLSGAHTIGISHCPSFSNRLYNFTGVGDRDPSLDSEYADNLRSRKCRTQNDTTTIVEMDPGSRKTFDLSYYTEFASSMEKMGLIEVKTGTSGEIRRNCAVIDPSFQRKSKSTKRRRRNERLLLDFGFACDFGNGTRSSCPKAEKIVQDYGGPSWKVPTGRRDGLLSNASEALAQIPAPFDNITILIQKFANKSLDLKDLVLLSGAHTIGISHCPSFSNRLYNFTGVGDRDPSLDSEYADNLRSRKCRTQNDTTTIVEMDPGSRNTFDLSYYTLLLKRRGLFESDSALTRNSNTLAFINQLLQGSLNFFSQFASSMEKMGQIEVKTGTTGEIRRNCA
ncbi:hypothetical protein M8C21_007371, partial [Ambrosia artemisiifolia]